MDANRRDLGRLEAALFGTSLRDAIGRTQTDVVA
jgi:hypothetical protein